MANEKRLIDLDELVAHFRATKIDEVFPNWKELFPSTQAAIIRLTTKYRAIVLNAPIVDAVSRGVLDQVRWERDVAIEQLESYGVSLGEKADVTKVVHGHWISLTDCANAGVYCSVCGKKVWKEDYAWCNKKNRLRSNYCPNCGAKMDGDGNETK